MATLISLLKNASIAYSDRVAFIDSRTGQSTTFGEFWRDANNAARILAAHSPSDAPVAILGLNSTEWVKWEAAVTITGRPCLPLNYRLSTPELLWQLDHADARTLIYSSRFSDVASELVAQRGGSAGLTLIPFERRLADDALDSNAYEAIARNVDEDTVQRILYTSATTGNPKGVQATHGRIVSNAVTTLANQLHDVVHESRYLVATPLTHMAIGYTWSIVAVGASCVMMDTFNPERFCEDVHRYRITHTLLVPTMVASIVDYLKNNPKAAAQLREGSLTTIWYAGAPMPDATLAEARRLIGPRLNQQYGLTELWTSHRSMCATMLRAEWQESKPGSCGRPLIGTEVAILNDHRESVATYEHGELAVRSSGTVLGYLNDEKATAETFRDGWTLSGDVAYMDDDGFVYIVDRKKDMIISGGLNIYSAELENALLGHPGVRQCAAVGAPHPTWGETPWVFVVRDDVTVSEEDLIAHILTKVGRYKAPSRVVFVDHLPIGPTGKILKRELRELASANGAGDTLVSQSSEEKPLTGSGS